MNKLLIISLTALIMCNLSCTHKNRGIIEQLNDDKRNVNIFLTDIGKNMIDKIIVLIHETEDILFNGIDKKDIQLLEEVLRKMLSNVGDCNA